VLDLLLLKKESATLLEDNIDFLMKLLSSMKDWSLLLSLRLKEDD